MLDVAVLKGATLPLAVAQTLFWASTYYLLPALLPVLERDTIWSKGHISGALTGALVVSALCSMFVGRAIDLGWGRFLMTLGGAMGSILLVLFSFTESVLTLYAVWFSMGACLAATLYEPCFAIVTRHHGMGAKTIITRIALVAGFAGTIAFPVANWVSEIASWQVAVRCFAALNFFVALPLAWLGLLRLEKLLPVIKVPEQPAAKSGGVPAVFWLLGAAFTLGGINQGMFVTHLLPLLGERGITNELAVVAAMVLGPMQVVGRLFLMSREGKTPTKAVAYLCFGGTALAVLVMLLAGANFMLVIFSAALFGGSWGIVSIVRPVLTRELLGHARFGKTSGGLGAMFMLGVAAAPSIGAWLWKLGGYDLMLMVGFGLAATGGLLLWFGIRRSEAL